MARDTKMDDRRQEERFPVKVRFDFQGHAFHGKTVAFQGRTDDLSKSGLSFFCQFNLSAKKCSMDLHLPSRMNGEPPFVATVDAKVVYSVLSGEKGFKVGVEFKKFHGDAKTLVVRELAFCQMSTVESGKE